MRAIATFPHIAPQNLAEFKSIATEMLRSVEQQESVLRYDMFFNSDSTQCVVLEEFSTPEAVFEHVKKNKVLLDQLVRLGGEIEGSIFPISEEGDALNEIKKSWNSVVHLHFAGKK
jgi:quinol monooxygenase YgiN